MLARVRNTGAVAGSTGETEGAVFGPSVHRLVLPLPPSANKLWINRSNGSGRSVTKAYERWRAEAAWRLRLQWRGPPLRCSLGIIVEFDRPLTGQKCDVDNRVKPLLDALSCSPKQFGVIVDDSQIIVSAQCWREATGSGDGLQAHIALFPLENFNLAFRCIGSGGGFLLDLNDARKD